MAKPDRAELETQIAADVRALTAESDEIGRHFAGRHDVTANDFRALLHVMVSESAGTPLTAGELRTRMGMSGAAITYLVERMIASGHFRRESDPSDRRKVILRVADDGLGISEEDQAGLFSAFFRTTNPAALSESGTGLGLAIVASIAERHAGHVDVESRLGEGTTFAVTLPAAGE